MALDVTVLEVEGTLCLVISPPGLAAGKMLSSNQELAAGSASEVQTGQDAQHTSEGRLLFVTNPLKEWKMSLGSHGERPFSVGRVSKK